jgi:putative Ca2+/H+ antiporter (TMEM165/GDT1 family)
LTAAFTLIFVSEIGDKVTSLQLKLFKCQLILCP